MARRDIEEGERWHKKVNVREIVFGFNDGAISTLALLSGVTGGALTLTGLAVASTLTFVSLFCIGVWKTTFTHRSWLMSGGEMVFVGILATVIPYFIGDLLLPSVLSAVA